MGLIEKLEIKVSNVQFVTVDHEEKVHIRFQGMDPEQKLNLNGYVVATVTEYEANSSLQDLSNLVKTKVLERLEGAQ